jgi:hypothetical protein
MWKESPNINKAITSVAMNVHHLSMSVDPISASTFILPTASRIKEWTVDSNVDRKYVMLKARANILRLLACACGSFIENNTGLRMLTTSIYHGLFVYPEPILWMAATDVGSEKETSVGLIRTTGPYWSCNL